VENVASAPFLKKAEKSFVSRVSGSVHQSRRFRTFIGLNPSMPVGRNLGASKRFHHFEIGRLQIMHHLARSAIDTLIPNAHTRTRGSFGTCHHEYSQGIGQKEVERLSFKDILAAPFFLPLGGAPDGKRSLLGHLKYCKSSKKATCMASKFEQKTLQQRQQCLVMDVIQGRIKGMNGINLPRKRISMLMLKLHGELHV
jgi:hypothetical protein